MTGNEETQPDWPAVSLAFGPIPAIYVRPSLEHPSVRHQHVSIGGTMPDIPADLKYSHDHLWARSDADTGLVRIGVTDFAQQSLGDVVAVTLPAPGEKVTAGEPSGDIESVKSVNDLVNTDPYGQGWMLEIDTDPATLGQQLAALMDPAAYREITGA